MNNNVGIEIWKSVFRPKSRKRKNLQLFKTSAILYISILLKKS